MNHEYQTYLDAAWKHLDQLTKPPRSLGRVEEVAAQLCAIQQTNQPQTNPRSVIVFAGDHGICEEGISAFPQSVTIEMMKNMSTGGAAVSVLSKLHHANLRIVDVGSLLPKEQQIPGVERHIVRNGTRNFAKEPAMTIDELHTAMNTGKEIIRNEIENDMRLLILGEMGIGNTTSATAIASAILKCSPEEVTGRGTGLDDAGLDHKTKVVKQALLRHKDSLTGTSSVLRCLGGFEIAAMTGAMFEAANHNIPILLDGFIVSAAALAAHEIDPNIHHCLVASHVSQEKGHQWILDHLNLHPLFNLNMRLGEASGALIALPVLDAASELYNKMATFESANISGKTPSESIPKLVEIRWLPLPD